MALSKLLAFDSLFEASELNVGLLVLLVLILAAVHFLSSMDRRRKLYGPVPCYRCWNAQCYGCWSLVIIAFWTVIITVTGSFCMNHDGSVHQDWQMLLLRSTWIEKRSPFTVRWLIHGLCLETGAESRTEDLETAVQVSFLLLPLPCVSSLPLLLNKALVEGQLTEKAMARKETKRDVLFCNKKKHCWKTFPCLIYWEINQKLIQSWTSIRHSVL